MTKIEMLEDLDEQIKIVSEKMCMTEDAEEHQKWSKTYALLIEKRSEIEKMDSELALSAKKEKRNTILDWAKFGLSVGGLGAEIYGVGMLLKYNFSQGRLDGQDIQRILNPFKKIKF